MLRLSEALMEAVWSNPFLEDAIANGYLNYSSFARFIRPRIEFETKKNVGEHAIKMALSRMGGKFASVWRPSSAFGKRISFEEGIRLFSVPLTQANVQKAEMLRAEGDCCSVTEWFREIDLVFRDSESELANRLFPLGERFVDLTGLSICTIAVSSEELHRSGFFYEVTKRMAFHAINVYQIASTYRELSLVIHAKDAKRAAFAMLGN